MLPTHTLMALFLERLLPGSSPGVVALRAQLLAFASDPLAKTALIRGPIGTGKSTVARMVALLKRVAPLEVEEADRILRDATFDGPGRIDLRYIPWFVEVALTGLVESIAEAQLFGVAKGAYTGADLQRAGVFESAASGRIQGGDPPVGALLTGGVVFLDEIGELSTVLQSKLLPILSGAPFYRLGGEGQDEHTLRYSGITVTASWRRLDDGTLREDLLTRIGTHVIDVPGLAERHADFEAICALVEQTALSEMGSAIDDLLLHDPKVDGDYWLRRKSALRGLDESAVAVFSQVDWSAYGNLRGLTTAIRQTVAAGADPETIVATLPRLGQGRPGTDGVEGILRDELLRRVADGSGLAGHLQDIEARHRRLLKDDLLADVYAQRRLASQLEIDPDALVRQIHGLGRRRTGRRAES